MFSFNQKHIINLDQHNLSSDSVYLPYNPSEPDSKWVIKHIRAHDITEFRQVMQDIALSFHTDHPSILPIRGFHIEDTEKNEWSIYMKMPKMKQNLSDLIHQQAQTNRKIPEEDIVLYLYSQVCAIEHLQNRGIAHRAIEPSNIFIDDKGGMNLSNLSFAMLIAEDSDGLTRDKIAGNRSYQAPELSVNRDPIKKRDLYKADMWSLGKVFAELCLLEIKAVKMQSIKNKKADIESMIERIGKIYSEELTDILRNMLCVEAEQRKNVGEVRKTLEDKFGVEMTANLGVQKKLQVKEQKKEYVEEQKTDETLHLLLSEIGSELPRQSAANIKSFERALMRSLQDKFTLELDKTFKIKALYPGSVHDGNIKQMIQDIYQTIPADCRKQVEAFELNVSQCIEISDQGLKDSCSNIGQLFPSLKRLKLDFSECHNVTKYGVKRLKEYFGPENQKLEHLTLNLTNCMQVTDEDVLYAGSEIKKNIPNQLSVQLDFNWGSGNAFKMPTSIKISNIC